MGTDLSPQRQEYLRRRLRRRRWVRGCQWGLLILLVALWEILARAGIIDSFILSQPSRIWRTWTTMFVEGELWTHMWVTIYETLVGFLLGVALGIGLAVLLWWSDFVAKVSEPYLVVLNSGNVVSGGKRANICLLEQPSSGSIVIPCQSGLNLKLYDVTKGDSFEIPANFTVEQALIGFGSDGVLVDTYRAAD